MKAIITVDVPEHQIGQEVSVYFKDSMCIKGVCESFKAIDELIDCSIDTLCQKYLTPIPDNATNGDVIKLLFQYDDLGIEVIEGNIRFNLGDDWWNAPYKAESED